MSVTPRPCPRCHGAELCAPGQRLGRRGRAKSKRDRRALLPARSTTAARNGGAQVGNEGGEQTANVTPARSASLPEKTGRPGPRLPAGWQERFVPEMREHGGMYHAARVV